MKHLHLTLLVLVGLLCANCSSTPAVSDIVTQTNPVVQTTQETVEPVEKDCPDNPHCPSDAIRCICDALDNLIQEDLDPDGDGTVNQRNNYTHDQEGNILTQDMIYGGTSEVYMHCVFNPPCAPGAECMPPSCTHP
jgi:hypothetical protein